MKYIMIFLAFFVITPSFADTYVKGHTRKDGTYVQPHTRSSPDSYRYNNRSSQSNGGNQRDEYSGATNKSNAGYGSYDNDNDGISNLYDSQPESSNGW